MTQGGDWERTGGGDEPQALQALPSPLPAVPSGAEDQLHQQRQVR